MKNEKIIGDDLKIPGFSYSEGWITNFQMRWVIKFQKMSGEAGSAEMMNCEEELLQIRLVIKEYPPHKVYNFDESALFYQMMPGKWNTATRVKGIKRFKNVLLLVFVQISMGHISLN